MKPVLWAAVTALALAAPAVLRGETQPSDVRRNAPTVALTIAGRHSMAKYRVEVARTPAEQELGLMYRTSMPANHGMIFPMDPPRLASFWMKNTFIPLDIVFIRPDHTISSIAVNAPTRSLATIDSTEPVMAVLELNGGAAAKAGLRAGDRVRW